MTVFFVVLFFTSDWLGDLWLPLTDKEIQEHLERRAPLREVPSVSVEPEFWDPVGLAVLFLFGMAFVVLFVTAGSTLRRRWTAGGPAAALAQGDLLDPVPTPAVVDSAAPAAENLTELTLSIANGAVQNVLGQLGSLFQGAAGLDEPTTTSTDDWVVPWVDPAVLPSVPVEPAANPALTVLFNFPWAWVFFGGALVGAALSVVPFALEFRRRRRVDPWVLLRQIYFFPGALFAGSLSGLFFAYGAGWLAGHFASPAALAGEFLALVQQWQPATLAGQIAKANLNSEVEKLLESLCTVPTEMVGMVFLRIPARRYGWVVALLVAAVVVQHVYVVSTAVTDVARFDLLVTAHKDLLVEMHNLVGDHLARADRAGGDPAVLDATRTVDERLLRITRRMYTGICCYEEVHQSVRPLLLEHAVPLREATWLERGASQWERLWR